MKSWKLSIALAVLSLLLAFVLAAAQEPVRSFDQLDTRLKPGDTIWVTDAQGREVKGTLLRLTGDGLALDRDDGRTYAAEQIRRVRVFRRDSLKNGVIAGGIVGAVLGVGLANFGGGDSGYDLGAAAGGGLLGGALGVVIGTGFDALVRGKKVVVYRSPDTGRGRSARLSFAPIVTPRAKGVVVSVAF